MTTEFRALFIHGVGSQSPTFADEARRNLRAALKARGIAVHFESVHWAPLFDRLEREFLREAGKHGSAINAAQKIAVGTGADALAYAYNLEHRENIFAMVDDAAARFKGHPYAVFGHSLGALIATDHMRSRARPARLVTMGCNIGLFTLGRAFEPIAGLTDWLNLFDDDDALGFSMGVDKTLSFVRDVEVDVGITGLSHTKYWDDHTLWSETIPQLLFG
jgi:pimeloyl-ACP methyl ester carboxylesterase